MGKVKKFATLQIRKITGGRDPQRVVEEFILRLGADPDECLKDDGPETKRWIVEQEGGAELEILLEGIKKANETTVYMGVNVAMIPLRRGSEIAVAALEVADGLVGIKVSLLENFLVLSASLGAQGMTVDELEYYHNLIFAQKKWFKEALMQEMGFDKWPGEQ